PYGQTLAQRPTDGTGLNHYLPGTVAGPSPFHQISVIAPDGAGGVWFADFYNSQRKLTRYDIMYGTFQETTPPAQCTGSNDMVHAPDGSLWFPGSSAACQIHPGGAVTSVPLPKFGSVGLTIGSDGRIWVSSYTGTAHLQAFNPGTCQDANCVSVYDLP